MIKQSFLNIFLFFLLTQSFAQSNELETKINCNSFNKELFQNTLLEEINNKRVSENIDELLSDSTLQKASEDQSSFMTNKNEVIIEQSGKKRTTKDRIAYYGGMPFGKELVYKYRLEKKDDTESYKSCIDKIIKKWFSSNSTSKILLNPEYLFAGISTQINKNKSHIYVSLVLGNYQSFANTSDKTISLTHPFSKKSYGLKPYDKKACKRVDKHQEINMLQKGLVKKGNIIYFQTDNYKQFKRLIKEGNDGIAIDLIQKEQYLSEGNNIIDDKTPWKGILYKPLYTDDLKKSNTFKGREAKYKLKSPIAKLDNDYGDNVEYNLLIIRDKHVCASIHNSYTENIPTTSLPKINYLADTITVNAKYNYQPVIEQDELLFKVPFKKNKYNYKTSDIEPIIKSLDEPNFVINQIEIEAFSSIEGGKQSNKKLQLQRAKSIEKALKSFISTSSNIDKAKVNTAENWADFCKDIQSTEFNYLSENTLEETKQIINSKLSNKLENILKKHRYALVKLHITYDINSYNEEKYVLNRFNKAIENNNKIKALAIQKFIFKEVVAERYSRDAVLGQKIPETAYFAGLKMNHYWLLKYIDKLEGNMCDHIKNLYKMQPDNMYLQFNDLLCELNSTDWLSNNAEIETLQTRLENLYTCQLPESTIDDLYLDFLFKVINQSSIKKQKNDLIEQKLGKIKELADIETMSINDASRFIHLFISHKDYPYAIKILKPFINGKKTNEDAVFTYLSLATHYQSEIRSHHFFRAFNTALELNTNRLKKLFTSGNMTIQVLENLRIKKLLKNQISILNKNLTIN